MGNKLHIIVTLNKCVKLNSLKYKLKLLVMRNLHLLIIIFTVLPTFLISQNTYYGEGAGQGGENNSFFGHKAGANNASKQNVFVGHTTGYSNDKGSSNVFVGASTGYKNVGSGNVFIGNQVGYSTQKVSNSLYIDNFDTKAPLLYGNFDKNYITIHGQLGIGTTSPSDALDVIGNVRSTSKFVITGAGAMHKDGSRIKLYSNGGMVLSGLGSSNEHFMLTTEGNVGIGTITPDEKLAVNGKIHAKEVRVDLNGWPDYVFENNYELPTLQEVENHIKTKGHLINIPSAKQVEKEGILVGEMNVKLLEKIEELTLYTLQQQKELEKQKQKNNALENRLNKLENLLEKNN